MSAPLGTVQVSSRNRCGLRLVLESTGETHTLSALARMAGVSVQAMRHRWMDAGRPVVIPGAMLRPSTRPEGYATGPHGEVLLQYPPHGTVTFRKIAKIHRSLGKSMQFFRDRWRRAGRPAVISAELFAHPDMRRIKDRAVPVPTDPKYLDDSLWPPDVPFADLCHLSNTENTGAGKGAISDEEWARMGGSVRSTMAGMYRRTTISSGRVIQKFWTGGD